MTLRNETDSIADPASGTGLLCDQVCTNHLAGNFPCLCRTARQSARARLREKKNIRFDRVHATLESIVKGTLASAACKDLSFDDEPACA